MVKKDRNNIQDILALTPIQDGMLFHYLKEPQNDLYLEQLCLGIAGEIEEKIFEKAWNFVIETNEMLRTTFRWENLEKPIQIILKEHHLQPGFFDLTGKSQPEIETAAAEIKIRERKKTALMQDEVPFHAALCKVGKDHYEIIITNHHILFDGWSNGVILKEFFNAYADIAASKAPLKPGKTKFKEFIKWLNKCDKGKQEGYWRNCLQGFESQSELSIKKRTRGEKRTAKNYQTGLDRFEKDKIEDFVKEHKITAASLFYSAWGILLRRYNNREDVVFGTTVSGRPAGIPGIENMVGLFINTIPLGVQAKPVQKAINLLRTINRVLEEREAFENTPPVEIKEYSNLGVWEELFDNIVVIENYPLQKALSGGETGGLTIDSYSVFENTHYDLTLAIAPVDDIVLSFEFREDLFDRWSIMGLADHYIKVISEIIANPGGEVQAIDLLSPEEKERILYDFNNTEANYPPGKTIHGLFMEQAERRPDRIAVVIEHAWLTYRELNEQSGRLAGFLIGQGVLEDNIVGIMMKRSIEMVIGIFGILKSGGAYLPIDPDYPRERIDYMLKDSSVKILINKSEAEHLNYEFASNFGFRISNFNSSNLAYIIYTSGTTGKPKGVLIEHASVVNRLFWVKEKYQLNEWDVILQSAPYVFDVSICEMFRWIVAGSRLCLLSHGGQMDPELIVKTIGRYGATTADFVPSIINLILDLVDNHKSYRELSSLRWMFTGVETVGLKLVKRFRETLEKINNTRLINAYGPTESTVDVTYFDCSNIRSDRDYVVPIGKPMANIKLYILDNDNGIQAGGVPGELCIAGAGLARGYLNNPELTAEKFIKSDRSYRSFKTNILYRTGDLCRWLDSGNIEFLGRIDQQVKIRGFRIEPGEIENRLLKHEQVKEAVVLPKEDTPGDKYLAAYFTADLEIPARELRNFLAEDLPDYMIPAYFVRLEKKPLTASGKVDISALPGPGLKAGEAYAAPRNEIEKRLVEIWTGVLGKNVLQHRIGIDDNFFRLGGHSLKANSLVSLVHKTFNVKIPLGEIFKSPTIRGLYDYINKAVGEQYTAIEPVEEQEYYMLSSAQKRLYFLQQMDNVGTVYNMPSAWLLEGVPDKSHLEKIFTKLIQRHESLRTSFVIINDEPVQRIHKQVPFEIEYNDLAAGITLDTMDPGAILHRFTRTFYLSQAPLLRVGLITIETRKHILMVDMHHIISDGTSMDIVVKDFMALYRGQDLPGLRVQYKDFSAWQNSKKQGEPLKWQEQYWINEFEEGLPVLELPTDYPRPAVQGFEGNSIHFEIDKETTVVLKKLTLETDVTLYMILLAIYNVFLSKISQREDIVVGSPIAGRRHADLEKIIGMFVNTLALRNYPTGEKTFTGFLHEVKERTLSAYENQDYQFEDLVERMVTNRDTSRNPVFDVMFVLQDMEVPEIGLPGLVLKPYDHENKTSKFDLNLDGMEKDGRLFFSLGYGTKLFKEETARRFSEYFKNIIISIIRNPGERIADIEIIGKEEKEKILEITNGIIEPVEPGETVHGMFEKIVIGNEDKTALVFRARRMTYRELARRANRLAGLLRDNGVGRDSVVGLMVERSFELVVGMLGVMKAGGAYLPIDPKLPGQRKSIMIEDSHMRLLLTNIEIERETAAIPGDTPIIDIRKETIYRGEGKNSVDIVNINRGADIAYVIYTSGSTGRPKGVMLEHINLVNLIQFHHKYTSISCVKVMQFATISFDISFQEIFSTLLAGGELYLIDEETRNNIPLLLAFIGKNKIKTLFLPMSFLKIIFNEDDYLNTFPRGVEHIQTAGEQVVVTAKFKKHLQENKIHLHNHYGPSETHVVTTFAMNPHEDIPEFPTIGKPIMNTGIHILDKAKQLLPIGVAGELYASGLQVGRGYLNNPELTAEKFGTQITRITRIDEIKKTKINKSFSGVYKTGDLARWLDSGNIEFLGRIDQQVKIRGIRVEPGEIESQLKKIEIIKEAIVVVKQDTGGEKHLCAYILLSAGTRWNDRELRNILADNLPGYMIPAYFVQVDKIPLTPSGKIDRNALPGLELQKSEVYSAPRNGVEKELARVWSEVLGRGVLNAPQLETPPGIDDNFFHMGGNSLKAIILVSKIHKVFELKIPLSEVFKHPTIRELAGYLKNAERWKYEQVELTEKQEYYAISSAQRRLYFLQQMDKGGTAYNISSTMILEGNVDKDKLEQAMAKLIRRHESFRSSIETIEEEPVQRVHENVEFKIEHLGDQKGGLPGAIIKSFIRSFDLSKAPLMRVALGKLEEKKYIFIVDVHHIITDGISTGIMVREFMDLYEEKELAPLKLQYKDFARWQNDRLGAGQMKKQEEYWKEIFQGAIPVLQLPYDYPRPVLRSFEGNVIHFQLEPGWVASLQLLARKENVTLYIILLSIYTLVLSRLGGHGDIVVGTPVAGRIHTDLQEIIGMFVNTLALRNHLEEDSTFTAFLNQVKEQTTIAFENQEYPFEMLVERAPIARDAGRNPLFDVMFSFENMNIPELEIKGLKVSQKEFESGAAKFDLNFSASEAGDYLLCHLEYCTALFKKETVERFIAYFKEAVSAIVNHADKKMAEIDIIPPGEINRLLFEFNDTGAEFPVDKTLHRLFEEQVERTPDRVALLGGQVLQVRQVSLTYRELSEQSDGLARGLLEKGAACDSIVGLMMERSVEMVIGILGIFKAGGVYMPIDPDYPRERIDYMLKDSAAKIVLTAAECVFNFHPSPFILHHSSHSLAYIIYTSGTTGKPKGVMIEHRGMVNHLYAKINDLRMAERSIVAQNASQMFDISVWQFFAALIIGGRTVIFPNEIIFEPMNFMAHLLRNKITVLEVVPSYLTALLDIPAGEYSYSSLYLQYLLVTGEAVNPGLLKRWFLKYPGIKVVNAYGPTEASDDITHYIMDKAPEMASVPIGSPVQNMNIHILDKQMNMCPLGVIGELMVSGVGIGRGYLNRPELTAEKFGPQITLITQINQNKSFSGGAGGRFYKKAPLLYRTGDLARWLDSGNIEFLGRIDHQVKIRGFRIELGEIENRLSAHENVKEAVVIDKTDGSGEKYLCAYIVFRGVEGTDHTELKSYLLQTLPEYMVPGHFVKIASIPLSPNGKVDRKALPEPGAKPEGEYVAPGTDKEREIAEIWKQVLGLEKVSINENFFDAGGNSLNIIKLAMELKKHLGIEIPTAKMFQYTTIASQAKYIAQVNEEETGGVGAAVGAETDKVKNKLKQRRDKIRR